MDNSTHHSFFVNFHLKRGIGQKVSIVGSIPELGSWDAYKSVEMTLVDPFWEKKVEFSTSTYYFEYKYVVFGPNGEIQWEEGNNRPFFGNFKEGDIKDVWDNWSSSRAINILTESSNYPIFREIRAMSFNVRFDTIRDGKFGWSARKHLVSSMIRFHKADIVGLQEPLSNQVEDILKDLKDFDFIGVGREDGKRSGEFSPILYKKTQYQLLDQGTFWLSEKPNVPGSKSWKTSCTRICSWGYFKPLHGISKDLCCFYFFNTHTDHMSAEARKNGVALILNKIQEITQLKYPVILTGDFNATEDSEEIRWITSNEKGSSRFVMKDCRQSETPNHGPSKTFTGFDLEEMLLIDYIFLHPSGTTCDMKVLNYGVLSDVWDGKLPPSDHRPIVADLVFVPKQSLE